jgi:Phage integrase family
MGLFAFPGPPGPTARPAPAGSGAAFGRRDFCRKARFGKSRLACAQHQGFWPCRRSFPRRQARPARPARPLAGDELRAIRRHLASRTDALPWLFLSERGQPLTRQAVHYLVAAAAARAGLPGVHPHTLRHACGFALANKGHDLRLIQDYLGHRDPRHTAHYTRTAGRRFEGLWR